MSASAIMSPWSAGDRGRRTFLMGIVNATPDSFSDGGECVSPGAALERAMRMEAEGADFIDIGAESTRPGAKEVSEETEWGRLAPVLEAVVGRSGVPVSVDTSKASVARRALEVGAAIINDVTALRGDPEMAGVVAAAGAGLVLMHNSRDGLVDGDLMDSIRCSLEESVEIALKAGVASERIVVDPGVGFGKSVEQNLEILRRLGDLRALGFPILLGASRKSVIGMVLDLPVEGRLEGTLATTVAGVAAGVDIVRVHDVDPNLKAARMADAIYRIHEPA